MIGKCRVCGTEYERRTNGRYCGDGCRRVGAMASYQRTLAKLRAKPKPEPKVARVASCKVCGKEFAANGGRQVYCGKDCYKRAVALNREKPVVDTAKRVCPHCGIEFEARRSGPHEKRFCSQRCSRRHRGREREKQRRAEASAAKYPFERSCKVCGAGFTVTVDNTNQVYCGPACRDAAYKKDNGETVTKRCEHCGKTFEEPAAWERGKRF